MKKNQMRLAGAVTIAALVLSACQGTGISAPAEKAGGAATAAPAAEEVTPLQAAVLCGDGADEDLALIQEALTGGMPDALFFDAGGSADRQADQAAQALEAGARILFVSPAVRESSEEALRLTDLAGESGAVLVFYGRPMEVPGTEGSLRTGQDRVFYVGTDPEEAGRIQGETAGKRILEDYEAFDRNGDGIISYALFKGQAGQGEAEKRARSAVKALTRVLTEAGHEAPVYFNSDNPDGYQLDLTGTWSAHAVQDYMETNLSLYTDKEDNMIELVLCGNDDMASGAAAALRKSGYNTGEEGDPSIPVYGIGASEEARDLIAQGAMYGSVDLNPALFLEMLSNAAYNAAAGLPLETGMEDRMDQEAPILTVPCSAYTGE